LDSFQHDLIRTQCNWKWWYWLIYCIKKCFICSTIDQ